MTRGIVLRVLFAATAICTAITTNAAEVFTNADYVALEQANPRLAAADHALNAAYKTAYAAASATGKQSLPVTERYWIHSRNLSAEGAGPIGSQAFVETLIKQTEARTAELDRMAQLATNNAREESRSAMQTQAPGPASDASPTSSAPVAVPSVTPTVVSSAPTPKSAETASRAAAPASSTNAANAPIKTTSVASAAGSATSQPAATKSDHSITTAGEILLGLIVLGGLVGGWNGFSGRIVVYSDYTDAAVATLGFWCGLATFLAFLAIGNALDENALNGFGVVISLLVFLVSQVLSVRRSLRSNSTYGSALLSVAAKLLFTLLFIAYAIAYLASGVDRRRRDDESDYAYALRMERAEANSKRANIFIAAISAVTVYLMHKLTRDKRWVRFSDYIKA